MVLAGLASDWLAFRLQHLHDRQPQPGASIGGTKNLTPTGVFYETAPSPFQPRRSAPGARGIFAPNQPKKRGIVGFSAYPDHAPSKDHGLDQARLHAPGQRLICHLPPVRLGPPATPRSGRSEHAVPGEGKPLGPLPRAQPIGARPRHPDGVCRGADRTGDVKLRQKPALSRLAPPVSASAQRHRMEERRTAASAMGESFGHRELKPQTDACRKMVCGVEFPADTAFPTLNWFE